jgi:hypothetical protein
LSVPDLSVLQTSAGHAAPFFYVGGDSGNTLWVATMFSTAWTKLVPCPTASAAIRFFVDPYRPNLIYILDTKNVKRSDNGGKTWIIDTNLEIQLTWNRRIAIRNNDNTLGLNDHVDLILTDMVFHPTDPRPALRGRRRQGFYDSRRREGCLFLARSHWDSLQTDPSAIYLSSDSTSQNF